MKNTKLIIGRTETGKTRGVLLKKVSESIENNENMVFVDTKQEYYKTYAQILKEKGYDIKVFNIDEPLKSDGFNPLYLPYSYYKNGDKDKSIDLISELALEIFKEENPNSDPFWANSAAAYFTGLTLILFKEAHEDEINMGSISSMITQSEQTFGDTTLIKEYLNNIDIMDPIYVNASQTAFAPNETRESILSVMKQKMNLFISKENLLNVICSNDIKINELNDKTAIFVINRCSKSNYNILGNILLDQLISDSNKSFTYYLDNFETMPILLGFNELLEKTSVKNSKVYVAIKDRDESLYNYGKFILSKFSDIIEIKEINEFLELGDYNEFPEFKVRKNKYFNFIDFMNKK